METGMKKGIILGLILIGLGIIVSVLTVAEIINAMFLLLGFGSIIYGFVSLIIAIVKNKIAIAKNKKEKMEEAAAVAAAQKQKEEDERLLNELKPKVAAGDAAAEKLFHYIEGSHRIVHGSSEYIRFRGAKTNTVYSTAGNILLQIIAESNGWDDFSVGNETDNTKNPKEGSMSCSFTAPTRESCSVEWGYEKKVAFYDYIHVSINLRTNSLVVEGILREFEEKMISFLKSQGASPVPGSGFEALLRFWNS